MQSMLFQQQLITAQMFASMDDAYMQGRAADVKDVSERVLDILCGVSNGTREMTEPCIVAADDLAPSETVQLDKEKVLDLLQCMVLLTLIQRSLQEQ